MKVKLTMEIVVDTEKLSEGHFNKLCEEYKNTHENLSMVFPNEGAYWSMEEVYKSKKRIEENEF